MKTCISGELEPDGERYYGVINDGKFIDIFSSFPKDSVPSLAIEWSNSLTDLHAESSMALKSQKNFKYLSKIRDFLGNLIVHVIMLPVLTICMLIPSFRRERKSNKEKLTSKQSSLPTDEELLLKLIEICKKAKASGKPLVYFWTL